MEKAHVLRHSFSDDVSVLLGRGDGSFVEQPRVGVGNLPRSVTTGQFNDDNSDGLIDEQDFLDLATANSGSNDVSVLRGRGDGNFDELMNDDGTPNRPSVGASPNSVTAGQFNDDNNDGVIDELDFLDLATANSGSDNVSVLRGRGDGQFSERINDDDIPIRLQVGTMPRSVTSGDIDNDGHRDLATANFGTRDVSVLLLRVDGTLSR